MAQGLPTVPYRAVNNSVLWMKKARNRVARCIRHAVDVNACEIVSISMGVPQMDPFGQRRLGQAVDHAYNEGVILIAAGGQYIDRVSYPGRFSRTIGVGDCTPDRKVWFKYDKSSAKGSIDIWAPSNPIRRADSVLDGDRVNYKTGKGDGTSYGTVHVVAAAAMWLVFRGAEIERLYHKPWQRIEAFRRLLTKTSQRVRGRYWPNRDRGILDIERLLHAQLPRPDQLKKAFPKAEKQTF